MGPEEDLVVSVLVVDDNRDSLVTLGILLRSEGYIVDLASSAREALRLARRRPPDAALLDLSMPGMDGFQLAHELQRLGGANPVLIAVTAHADQVHRDLAERSGIAHFVGKPYDPQALLGLLGSLRRRPNLASLEKLP